MLENWPWDKEQLKSISKHYETGKSMDDDELSDLLIKAGNIIVGNSNMKRVLLANFDMAIHQLSESEAQNVDLVEKWDSMMKEYCLGTIGDSKSHRFSSIFHLMGGYDSGYYGYLWSEVYAYDMYYTKFKTDPLNPKVGYEYKVLGPGGSRDAMESLKDFLGREPNNHAFMKELGISDSSKV